MKTINFLAASILAISLIGCGGSSVSRAIDEGIIEDYAKGVYDISTNSDRLYFTIDKKGYVNTYRLDTNENCYKKNENPGLNSSINGRRIDVDISDSNFELDSIRWYYSSKDKITKVRIGTLVSSTILESNNIRVATSKYRTSIITMGELNQSVCN